MSASSKEPHKNNEKTVISPDKDFRPETINKIFSITRFTDNQVRELCKVGVARNLSEFFRIATRALIRENQHLLKNSLIPANWKEKTKKSVGSKSSKNVS